MKKTLLFFGSSILLSAAVNAQCANEDNIHSFIYDGKAYEIVKENKNWEDAASCAVERGGMLIQIDSEAENTAVYNEISAAGVVNSETISLDGGGGAYLWIGATDIVEEGTWIWDGENTGSGDQFWEGAADGTAVGGLYNNWGNEPDNFGGVQDAGAISINGWPLGDEQEWNDVNENNTLFFIVEKGEVDDTGIHEEEQKSILIYPNPATDVVYIENTTLLNIVTVVIRDVSGKRIGESTPIVNNSIDISNFENGLYLVELIMSDGSTVVEKIMK